MIDKTLYDRIAKSIRDHPLNDTPPDARDHLFKVAITEAAPPLEFPPAVDSSAFVPPVQFQLHGDCTGHAYRAAEEFMLRANGSSAPSLSGLFLYVQSLKYNGQWPHDVGSDLRTPVKMLQKIGTCTAATWPENNALATEPSADAYAEAPQYRVGEYLQIPGGFTPFPRLNEIKSLLAQRRPVVVAVIVTGGFLNAPGGVVPYPPGGSALGGHALMLFDYDEAGIRFQTQWGGGWGKNGIGVLLNSWFAYIPGAILPAIRDAWTFVLAQSDETDNFIASLTQLEQTIMSLPTAEQANRLIATGDNLTALGTQILASINTPPAPVEFVVDNLPPGQSSDAISFTGVWQASTSGGSYNGGGSIWAGETPTTSSAPATYTFKSPPLPAGQYAVEVWWTTHANRSAHVPVTAGGVTITMNQRENAAQWMRHGTYAYADGEVATVTISNANGQCCADAVRWARQR